ncbi:hypothetical protein GOARA_063_00560 [Gordonia araii NBRC 100433]|uniref:DUF2867 domain-containing protein n=1 Tax=Gordonia araii NBRC 100433 TaxID=1073574 RepID=G7H4T2_9ACTN|nr:hypothetical protein GOARA_063_00560 [Gordonia araii NBRC 100433]
MIAAGIDDTWRALQETTWSDLLITKPLMRIRGHSLADATRRRLLDPPSPMAPIHEEAPHYLCSGMIGRPWQLHGDERDVPDLAALVAFDEPGWLKYGAEFVLVELPDGRTRLETTTLCEATDSATRRKFGCYWAVIRPFSGLIRRDILRAIDRRTQHQTAAAHPTDRPTS